MREHLPYIDSIYFTRARNCFTKGPLAHGYQGRAQSPRRSKVQTSQKEWSVCEFLPYIDIIYFKKKQEIDDQSVEGIAHTSRNGSPSFRLKVINLFKVMNE